MSILIKGMKMPHSCIGCRFCEHGSINEWDLYCGINNKHIGNWDDKHLNNGWRHPECPLVPVPTPHGWLADIEAVYKEITNYYKQRTELQHIALRECLSRVPTIIEAEGEAHETD